MHEVAVRLWTLEKTTEVQFGVAGVTFRIEAFRAADDPRIYRIRLMRYESFRVTPSFGDYPEGGADHEVPVADPLFDGQEVSADSPDAATQIVLQRLEEQGFR
jgi:hypothetical protein